MLFEISFAIASNLSPKTNKQSKRKAGKSGLIFRAVIRGLDREFVHEIILDLKPLAARNRICQET